MSRVRAWFRYWFTGWVGYDQWGEYSRMDRLDGLS